MDSNANVRPLKCPTLTSGSLIIRPLTLDDLIAFTAYRADPNVARYQSWTDYHYQDALSLLNLTNYQDFAKAGQWYQLAISDQHELLMGDLAVLLLMTSKLMWVLLSLQHFKDRELQHKR